MDRVQALRDAAKYAEWYAQGQEAIKEPNRATHARAVRTELLNMADELSSNASDGYTAEDMLFQRCRA